MSAHELKSFITNLQQDLKRLDKLNELFDKQYELMSSKQSLQLEQLNEQAMELLQAIQHSHLQREQWLNTLGLKADRSGISLLLEKLPESLRQATSKLLEELTLKSRLCHAQNERSGQLLASQRQLMQKLTGLNTRTSYPGMPL